jgi:hypothetical protein
MRLFQGKSFAEIMPLLGYDKEVTVRSLHLRALTRLQELMQPFDDGSGAKPAGGEPR